MSEPSWLRSIVPNPDHPEEMMLDLGDELCQYLGWKENDTIEWVDNKDGSWTLQKIDKENNK